MRIIWILYFISYNGGDGGVAVFSPYVIVSAFLISLKLFQLMKNQKWTKQNIKTCMFGIGFVIFSILNIILNGEDMMVLLRNLFLLLSLCAVSFVTERSSKFIINIFVIILCIECFLRFTIGDAYFSLNIYSYKNSIIFPDTNFLGIVLLPIFIYFFYFRVHFYKRVSVISLLALTASRAAWLSAVTVFVFRNKSIQYLISLLLIIFPVVFAYTLTSFVDLDGSLSTKFDILLGFTELLLTDLPSAVYGVGKAGAVSEMASLLGRKVHVGHTIYGNFVQYGILTVSFYLLACLSAIPIQYRSRFLLLISASGATGLFTFSYLPMICVLFTAVAKTRSNINAPV